MNPLTRRSLLQSSLAGAMIMASRSPAALPGRGPLVIEPDWLLTTTGDELIPVRNGSVLIDGGRIGRVSEQRIRGRHERLSLPGHLLLPGLISCHTHVAAGSPTRGLFEGRRSYRQPLQWVDRLDADELDWITAYNLAELLRSGCTTQLDMALSLKQCQSYVRVASRWGVRGYPSAMIPSTQRLFHIWGASEQVLLDSVAGTLEEIAACHDFAENINGSGEGLLRPQMAAHACDTHTEETLRTLVAASHRLGNGLHIHLSQSHRETELVMGRHGVTPTQWLAAMNAFEQPVFGAHMTGLDLEQDPEILRANGATYAHCPLAGGANGFTQPWPELLQAGVNCTVAIDTHSNDMIENLKLAVIKGEARWMLGRQASAVPMRRPTIWDAVKGATLNAARGLQRSDLGRLEEGALADLVALDLSGPLTGVGAPPPEPLYHLLYANGLAVRHVMINGDFKIFDGALVNDDFTEIAKRAGAVLERLWADLRDGGYFEGPT